LLAVGTTAITGEAKSMEIRLLVRVFARKIQAAVDLNKSRRKQMKGRTDLTEMAAGIRHSIAMVMVRVTGRGVLWVGVSGRGMLRLCSVVWRRGGLLSSRRSTENESER
jgi:hypothetical protein